MGTKYRPITLSESDRIRFEKRVVKGSATDCWIFSAKYSKRSGHRYFSVGGVNHHAHRVAWILAGNEITEDKPHILHNCPGGDNAACCNPAHLFAGTIDDNAKDRALKGQIRKSKSGLPFGVHKCSIGKPYRVCYAYLTKTRHFGGYDDLEQAAAVALFVKEIHLGIRFLADPNYTR